MLLPSLRERLGVFDPRTQCGQIYLSFLALRCYSAFFGYGYIHPDEWMQSGQAYHGLSTIAIDARVPWEWRPDKALRSLSSLYTQLLAQPFLFMLYSRFHARLTGRTIFLIPRASVLLWTLFVDFSVVSLFPPTTARYILCLFAASTAATTFLVRPFSNSHEANILALLLIHVLSLYRNRSWYKRNRAWGWYESTLAAFYAVDGFFCRFTFAIFALPPLAFLAHFYTRIAAEGYKKVAFRSICAGLVGGLCVLWSRVGAETELYTRTGEKNGIKVATLCGTKWVVPPINALLYNMKTENVAQHGLHPRWLHAVVNLPMIVGVANCVVIATHGWHFVNEMYRRSRAAPASSAMEAAHLAAGHEIEEEERKAVEQAVQTSVTEKASTSGSPEEATASSTIGTTASALASASSLDTSQRPQGGTNDDNIDIEPVAVGLSLSIILFSLLILSLSPHQEPRFLLALAFPSTIIMAYGLQSRYFTLRPTLTRTLLTLHVVQHLLQLVLFSFLHQGALLPTLFSIDNSLSLRHLFTQTHLIYRTFSIPFHLLPNTGANTYVEHWDGSVSPWFIIGEAGRTCDFDTWVYAPSWIVPELREEAETEGGVVELSKVESFTWHVDMDHLGESWALVGKLGLREAFAIQKLKVRCRSASNQALETEKEEHTLFHTEL